jgi:dTDP-4-amino-4,6-dideoxygalactose transaminase
LEIQLLNRVKMKSHKLINSVPFNDLYKHHMLIKDELDFVIKDVIDNSLFIRGKYVDKFETMFQKLMNIKYSISCANGTDALTVAMYGLGIQQSDEVIVPAHSWVSTASSVKIAGGNVVFCDTHKDNFTIDVSKIEEKITSKTKGIIPVHLYGCPADMNIIMKIAKKYKLWVLEDCAQAHLAKYKNKLVGTFGDAACFSFYPGKNLGAMGDAGAVVTNNKLLAEKIKMYSRHGGLKKGDHFINGINSRLDGLQAAILTVKMKHLEYWTSLRQKAADIYNRGLRDLNNVVLPNAPEDCEHVWHLYTIKTNKRDALVNYLNTNNVQTVVNYPIALPFLPSFKYLSHACKDFPNAFFNQSRILSIPIYPEIEKQDLNKVIELIKEFENKIA